ncbi:uncharacterized protein LOC111242940 isoform X2 [Varroa destructor]|uniref:Tudor domain-containing protein n=1 Tax=Varroa destructor TaxID=109461 RepID=A0A7M7JAB7_VARDE|nr:uncharacterized protein LOC111242940 isoform X2 [Varroa destructor]
MEVTREGSKAERHTDFATCEAETSDESSLTTRLASRWTELMNNSDSEVGERVLVIHHDSTKLGVQLLRFDVEKLRKLETRLREEAKSMKPYNSEQLTEQAVVAVYVDSAVVRGVVSTVIENEARVHLLDYGITVTLNIDKLRKLPKEFVTELPLYGIRVLIDKNYSIGGPIRGVDNDQSLMNRIVHLVSLVPCSLTTARARIHVIEPFEKAPKLFLSNKLKVSTSFINRSLRNSTEVNGGYSVKPGGTANRESFLKVSDSHINDTASDEVLDCVDTNSVVDEDQQAVFEVVENIKMQVIKRELATQPELVEKDKAMDGPSAVTYPNLTTSCKRQSSKESQKVAEQWKKEETGLLTSGSVNKGARKNQREKWEAKAKLVAAEVFAQVKATIPIKETEKSTKSANEEDKTAKSARRNTGVEEMSGNWNTSISQKSIKISSESANPQKTPKKENSTLTKDMMTTKLADEASRSRKGLTDENFVPMNRSNETFCKPKTSMHGMPLHRRDVIMDISVKFLRRTAPCKAIVLSLSLLSDVEKTLKSLKVPPLRLPQFKIAWGTRILIRRPQGLCRATIDWKEPKGAWWHCIFDDLDDPPVHVRLGEILECPSNVLCLPRALLYVHISGAPDLPSIFPKPRQVSKLSVLDFAEVRGSVSNLPMNRVFGFFPEVSQDHEANFKKSEATTSFDGRSLKSSQPITTST